MSKVLGINDQEFKRLEKAIHNFPGKAEDTINAFLHSEGKTLIMDSIQQLIPQSGKTWKGKKAPAQTGKSLRSTNANLAIWVRSTKNYQYLYFPDDGSNTRRHVGNQQFFFRGAESVKGEVIDRCIGKLITQTLEKGD
jgi:hypothetical protein